MRQGSNSSELLMCDGGARSIFLLLLVARDNRCMYMAHVCCVAAVVENSRFSELWSVEVCCMFV